MSKAEDRYLEHFQDGRLRNCSSKEAFLLGYHQAEKDLGDISWIKEVSGVKDMSRAKEEALKAYPPQSIAANYYTINRRDAFEYGYLKAEKDLELGWEDIKIILDIENDILRECNSQKELIIDIYPKGEDYYGEILKRFKELKNESERL